MNKHFYIVLIISFLILGNEQSLGQQKLNNYIDHLFNNQKFMGSIAISHNDSIIYSKYIGYINIDSKEEINKDTKFRIGSVTKTFTATLIIKAIEEEKLKFSDKLEKYYPEIKNADKITIEQLLKHRSGIYNFTEKTGSDEWEQYYHSEKEFLEYIANDESDFEPDTEYKYSNTNYALLGFILQKVYHKSFADILDEKICKPLQLKNTYYTYEVDPSKNEALSYNIQNTYIRNSKINFSNDPGSGGIASTVTDINKFIFALFNEKLISKQNLEQMLPNEKGAYGMGIEKLTFDNPVGYAHNGRIENYFSEYLYFPEENLGIVTLSNAININIGMIDVTLLKSAYGQQPELPNFNKIAEISEEDFNEIKGTYFLAESNNNQSITISSDGEFLFFQDSRAGQMYVPFEYKEDNTFQYENTILHFIPSKKEVHLDQNNIKQIYIKG